MQPNQNDLNSTREHFPSLLHTPTTSAQMGNARWQANQSPELVSVPSILYLLELSEKQLKCYTFNFLSIFPA